MTLPVNQIIQRRMMRWQCERKWSWPNLRYRPETLRKTTKKSSIRTVFLPVGIRTRHLLNTSSKCCCRSQRARYSYYQVTHEPDINCRLQTKYNSAATAYSWANYLKFRKPSLILAVTSFPPCRPRPNHMCSVQQATLDFPHIFFRVMNSLGYEAQTRCSIPEEYSSNLEGGTGYPERGFSWYFSVSPSECILSQATANSFTVNKSSHYLIRH
jgi:hypothetical protein